jgi:copper chaperone
MRSITTGTILGICILVNGCGKSDDNSKDKANEREIKENKSIETKSGINQSDKKEITNTDKMKNIEIKTKGMSCSHCENSVKTEIGKLGGIKEVTADAKTNIVKVTFDAGKTDIKAIEQAIDEAGYEVVEVNEK